MNSTIDVSSAICCTVYGVTLMFVLFCLKMDVLLNDVMDGVALCKV